MRRCPSCKVWKEEEEKSILSMIVLTVQTDYKTFFQAKTQKHGSLNSPSNFKTLAIVFKV